MSKSISLIPSPVFDSLDTLDLVNLTVPDLDYLEVDDFKVGYEFLFQYRGNVQTFTAYRREIERFLQWSWLIAKKPITSHTGNEIEQFIEFCLQPPKEWISKKLEPRFIENRGTRSPNPNWRPFNEVPVQSNQQLANKSVQTLLAILGSFYAFLAQKNYTNKNPVLQLRQKSKYIQTKQTVMIRRLTNLQWQAVHNAAKKLAAEDPKTHERTLFIINALFGMYLRISELVASKRWEPQMGHFFQDQQHNWWFKTVGKGNKERLITVSDAMLQALKRYRQSLGLSPLPHIGETMPLLSKQKGVGAITSTRRIRMLVQSCFDDAVHNLKQEGLLDESQQLEAATVHWLRHTAISEDVKIRPREHVRDDAGHGSSYITDKYIDNTLAERHASGKNKKLGTERVDT